MRSKYWIDQVAVLCFWAKFTRSRLKSLIAVSKKEVQQDEMKIDYIIDAGHLPLISLSRKLNDLKP